MKDNYSRLAERRWDPEKNTGTSNVRVLPDGLILKDELEISEELKSVRQHRKKVMRSVILSVEEQVDDLFRPERFLEDMERYRKDFVLAGRRFVMEWISNLPEAEAEPNGGFRVERNGKTFRFSGTGMEKARTMSVQELQQYCDLIREIMRDNEPESDLQNDYPERMLAAGDLPLLERSELLRTAHALRFSFDDVQRAMLRMLQDDGFSARSSEDLIELFCFCSPAHNRCEAPERMKKAYREMTGNIKPDQSEDAHQTRLFTQMLNEHAIAAAPKDGEPPEQAEAAFLAWMAENAPRLDRPSRKARDIYRALIAYAYRCVNLISREKLKRRDFQISDTTEMMEKNQFLELYDSESFADNVMDAIEQPLPLDGEENAAVQAILEYIYTHYNFSFAYYSGDAVYEKMEQRDMHLVQVQQTSEDQKGQTQSDARSAAEKLWRNPIVTPGRELVQIATGAERMMQILRGEIAVQKSDLLMILYFLFSFFNHEGILDEDAGDDDPYGFSGLGKMIETFIDVSRSALTQASLPDFYAAHPLESTMLSAISASFATDYEVSVWQYFLWLCEALQTDAEAVEQRVTQISFYSDLANAICKQFKDHIGEEYAVSMDLGSGPFSHSFSLKNAKGIAAADMKIRDCRSFGKKEALLSACLLKELKLLRKLSGERNFRHADHFFTVNGEDGEPRFYVTIMNRLHPFVSGAGKKTTRLYPHFKQKDAMPEETALRMALDLSAALAACERLGTWCRSVCPKDIFVAGKGEELCFMLEDLGLAKSEKPFREECMTWYSAPELLSPDGEPDCRCAVYSLGAILYECLAAKEHFSSSTYDLNRLKISPEMKRILEKALQPDPEKRFASAQEMRTELLKINPQKA